MALKAIHNEAELLTRISQGDENAFTDLFWAYHNQLGAFVNSLTDSPEMTEEIVQDIFVKIWMDRRELPRIEKFPSYLFILTRNYTLNSIRKTVSHRRQLQEYVEVNQNPSTVTELFSETEPDYHILMERAIAELPLQQQRVFVLRKEGLKNPEIALQLGITIDSVKKYQQLALRTVTDFVKMRIVVPITLIFLLT